MKAKFLKIAKVKSEQEFYKKYPTEEAFFNAHPEARNIAQQGKEVQSSPATPEIRAEYNALKEAGDEASVRQAYNLEQLYPDLRFFPKNTQFDPNASDNLPGEQYNYMHRYSPDFVGYREDGTPVMKSDPDAGQYTQDTFSYAINPKTTTEFVGNQGKPQGTPKKLKASPDPKVVALQQQLNQMGAHLVVDGIMGPKTKAAMEKYMSNQNIAVNTPTYTSYTDFPTDQNQVFGTGGQPYPWAYPEYGMQGKGAGAQIPVETYYAYGGFTSNPAATLVHYNHGGNGQYAHPSNYGAFPAFAKHGGRVFYGTEKEGPGYQGGNIDSVIGSYKNNYTNYLQNNALQAFINEDKDQATALFKAAYGMETSTYDPTISNQNMFSSALNRSNQDAYNSMGAFGDTLVKAANYGAYNWLNNKNQENYREQQQNQKMYSELGKDAQTTPGFNPIPGNMAKFGGSLKKYQAAGTTGTNLSLEELEKQYADLSNRYNQDLKNAKDKAAVQKAKDELDFQFKMAALPLQGTMKPGSAKGQALYEPPTEDQKRQHEIDVLSGKIKAIKKYNETLKKQNLDPNKYPAVSTTPAPVIKSTLTPAPTPATTPNKAGQVQDKDTGIWYTPIKSDDEYWNMIDQPKTNEQYIASRKYKPKTSYDDWAKTQSGTTQQKATPSPSTAKKTTTTTTTSTATPSPAKKEGKQPYRYTGTATQKPQLTAADTTGLAAFKQKYGVKKAGGAIEKFNGGGGILHKQDPFTMYNDGSIQNNQTGVWVREADSNWKDPSQTTGNQTSTQSDVQPDAREKAVRDLAIAYGQDPDQVWTAFQNMNTYGTMGAGTNQPYGYGYSDMVPYRYHHRGYGPIGYDRGYIPGEADLAAMEKQANELGYDFTGKSRPTLFGGRKVVVKTHYNPSTGKVEQKPEIDNQLNNPSIPGNNLDIYNTASKVTPFQDQDMEEKQRLLQKTGWRERRRERKIDADPYQYQPYFNNAEITDEMKERLEKSPQPQAPYTNDKITAYNKGNIGNWLRRNFGSRGEGPLPGETYADGGYTGINVPITDTLHNVGETYRDALTSIKDFYTNPFEKKDGRSGLGEKSVWKTGPSPYAADILLTGMGALSSTLGGFDRKKRRDELQNRTLADVNFNTLARNTGDRIMEGQQHGALRPNQMTPVQDSGYDRGFAGGPARYRGFDRGGSIGYSDWSQTPVNGYYGVPQGEFTPYSQWSQRPVMAQGGSMMQDGEYEIDEKDLADFMKQVGQAGGQVQIIG